MLEALSNARITDHVIVLISFNAVTMKFKMLSTWSSGSKAYGEDCDGTLITAYADVRFPPVLD